MKPTTSHQLVATLLFIAVASSLVLVPLSAMPLPTTRAEEAEGFVEMLPGVLVGWTWWNQTDEDYPADRHHNETTYLEDKLYTVQDIYGHNYAIFWMQEHNLTIDWTSTGLFVVFVCDADRSITQLPTVGSENGTPCGYWEPPRNQTTGDEVLLYSTLEYSYTSVTSVYHISYGWINESSGVRVNPNDVALAPGYEWAAGYNTSWIVDESWAGAYTLFNFAEWFQTRQSNSSLQTVMMQHATQGFGAFIDANDNGRMDLNYNNISLDANNDSIPDYEVKALNVTTSELAYQFKLDRARVGEAIFPFLNDQNEIEWSMEFVDIEGQLIPAQTLYSHTYFDPFMGVLIAYPTGIPATVDSLKFVCRFAVVEGNAVLKVDQHIGALRDSSKMMILPEAAGLSLAISYLTTIDMVNATVATTLGEITPASLESALDVEDGNLTFSGTTRRFAAIDFGGNYTWGKDGSIYNVTALVTPLFTIVYPLGGGPPLSTGQNSSLIWTYVSYYYTSCYAHWDGYPIIHDPIYTVFPGIRGIFLPDGTWALVPAIVVTVVAVFGIGIVVVRMRGLRKAPGKASA